MARGFLKAAIVLVIGLMTTLASCVWLTTHPYASGRSNGILIAELLTPLALGVAIGFLVYWILFPRRQDP
jgi:hypothetical protein